MSQSMLLKDYKPKSNLVVQQHQVLTPKFPVIDIHTHFGPLVLGDEYEKVYDTGTVTKRLRELNIRYVCNHELLWGDGLDRLLRKLAGYEDFILTFASVDVSRLDDEDFATYVDQLFRDHKSKGIRGIKLWKNISLGMKDRSGKYIAIDDSRLKPVWEASAKYELPILIHIADPKGFFTPVDEYNEYYECLHVTPEWSFCSPKLYSFEQLMQMQENMLADNPDTTFIIAHVGSYGENLGFVGRLLDKYKNMYIDIAARINELGRQPYTARKFFIDYQDRILFGTDYSAYDPNDIYPYYFRFLETFDEYFDYQPPEDPIPTGRWKIYGIGLEDDVLEKIYCKNAQKLLKLSI